MKALTSIVKINAQYAVPHQDVVIDCLDHEDMDIRQKVSVKYMSKLIIFVKPVSLVLFAEL